MVSAPLDGSGFHVSFPCQVEPPAGSSRPCCPPAPDKLRLPECSLSDPSSPDFIWNASHKLFRVDRGSSSAVVCRAVVGDVDLVQHSLREWMAPLSLQLPSGLLLECSRRALDNLPFAICEAPTHLEIHVDGSGSPLACWSFAVVWTSANRLQYFGGFRSGSVCTDPDWHEFLGADVADSNSAELSGFAWALSFALQYATTTLKSVDVSTTACLPLTLPMVRGDRMGSSLAPPRPYFT